MANTITIILSAVDRASAVFKRTEDSLQRMATTAQIAGAAMTAAFTLPIIAGAKKAVQAASNLQEAVNKTNVAFGESAAEIVKWSENSVDAFGMSKRAALESVATFQLMFTGMGVTADQSQVMSKRLVELAADLHSIHNIPIADAFEKIRSGMAGMSRPLLDLGIDLRETAVAQHALKMGLKATTAELTEQDKVLARYSLLLETTKPIHGDFANTSNNLSNLMEKLNAIMENAAASLGTKFIPSVERAVIVLIDMIKAFTELPDGVQESIVKTAIFVAALGPLIGTAGTAVRAILGLKAVFAALNIGYAIKWISTFIWLIGQGGLGTAIQIAIPKLYALGTAAWASIGPFAALAAAILLFVKVIHDNWATIQKAVAILAYKATGKMPDWAFKIDDSPRGALDVSSGGLKLENFTKQKTVPGFARGGSFKVPSGYPNDSYLMGVSSGEHVSVNPAGQGSAAPVILNITMPQISGATAQELADQLWPMLRSQLRRGGLAA
jgi:hypothetical protein